MKKKLFGAMALATVAGLVLAGCGTGREDTWHWRRRRH